MSPRRLAVALVLAALTASGCGAAPAEDTVADRSAPQPPSPSPPGGRESVPAEPRRPTASISVPAELRSAAPDVELLGADMSWPQCPPGTGIPQKRGQGAPYPLGTARYVVLGLTNGPGFTANPCLADQLAFVRQNHLRAAAYAVLSLPSAATLGVVGDRGPYDAGDRLGRLRNAGYAQATYAVATMARVGLSTPIVWLDVEPVPDFDWSADTAANAAVVVGAARGYREAGYPVGVYSTPSLWRRVVGDLRLGVPEWRAAGQTSRAEAERRCRPDRSIQGGAGILTQWVQDGRDLDVTCPGAVTTTVELARWFHRT